jgi:hypothetical protein
MSVRKDPETNSDISQILDSLREIEKKCEESGIALVYGICDYNPISKKQRNYYGGNGPSTFCYGLAGCLENHFADMIVYESEDDDGFDGGMHA